MGTGASTNMGTKKVKQNKEAKHRGGQRCADSGQWGTAPRENSVGINMRDRG